MKPGDRLVCAFIEPLAAGDSFKNWPLHVTIVPWFRLEIDSDTLTRELERALAGIETFEARAGSSEKFGNRGSGIASLLAGPTPFSKIEKRVREVLKRHDAWLVDESTKRRRPYRPHVTFQKSGHLQPGDVFNCDRLFIIEQKGDHKQVAAEVKLKP